MSKIGAYTTKDFLGAGQFGSVVTATRMGSSQLFAIKRISKQSILQSSMTDQVKKEISIMKNLKHPNIVRTEEVLMSPKYVFICMEHVTGGELHSKIALGKLDDKTACKYTRQLSQALKYCHDQNICHRDIKPQNILLDKNDNVKLVDFGFASVMEFETPNMIEPGKFVVENHTLSTMETLQTKDMNLTLKSSSNKNKAMHTYCGTEQFMAPEITSRSDYFGDKVDMWALGMVLHFMLMGRLPDVTDKYIPGVTPRFLRRIRSISNGAKDVLESLLRVDPNTRSTAGDVLKYPWILGSITEENEQTYSSEEEGGDSDESSEEECEYSFSMKVSRDIDTGGMKLIQHIRSILDDENLKSRVKGDSIVFVLITTSGFSNLKMDISQEDYTLTVNEINLSSMKRLEDLFYILK